MASLNEKLIYTNSMLQKLKLQYLINQYLITFNVFLCEQKIVPINLKYHVWICTS